MLDAAAIELGLDLGERRGAAHEPVAQVERSPARGNAGRVKEDHVEALVFHVKLEVAVAHDLYLTAIGTGAKVGLAEQAFEGVRGDTKGDWAEFAAKEEGLEGD